MLTPSMTPAGSRRVARRAPMQSHASSPQVWAAGLPGLLAKPAMGTSALVGKDGSVGFLCYRLGEKAPHALLRGVFCTRGRATIEMVYRTRPEYGLVVPIFTEIDSGFVATGGSGRLTLSLPSLPSPAIGSAGEIRVLQAMSYQPTGAIVAAATTSLPEEIGGERNWDYRYSWVRDASFTMKALWVAACPDEAHEFFDFMTAAAAHSRPERHLQIMFGIGGEHDLSERTLPHLSGWRGSGPVRVGNGAWNQPQLDVYGELLDAAFRLREQLGEIEPATRTFLIALADAAASQWQQPDNGIWEVRGAPRHFLYSKLMCWVALDRAIAMAEQLCATDRIAEWSRVAARIRSTILSTRCRHRGRHHRATHGCARAGLSIPN